MYSQKGFRSVAEGRGQGLVLAACSILRASARRTMHRCGHCLTPFVSLIAQLPNGPPTSSQSLVLNLCPTHADLAFAMQPSRITRGHCVRLVSMQSINTRESNNDTSGVRNNDHDAVYRRRVPTFMIPECGTSTAGLPLGKKNKKDLWVNILRVNLLNHGPCSLGTAAPLLSPR